MTRTYITVVMAPEEENFRPTKAAFRNLAKVSDLAGLRFVSVDSFHDEGRKFTLDQALAQWGPYVGLEVHKGNQSVAMIEADRHPSGAVNVRVP